MTLPKYVHVQKGEPGAFTCLGNWYNLYDTQSMTSLLLLINQIRSLRDLKTAIHEVVEAHRLYQTTGFAYPGNNP